jgi:hypothetical protein
MVLAVMLHRCKLVLLLCRAKRAAAAVVRAVVLLVLAVGALIQTHQMQTGGVVPMASLVDTMRYVLMYTYCSIATYVHCSMYYITLRDHPKSQTPAFDLLVVAF